MAIMYSPGRGSVLLCDFNHNSIPEMTKKRPVVVLSDVSPQLCIVVPFSTTSPVPLKPHHYQLIDFDTLPPPYDKNVQWVKCDMIYTVSYQRLSFPFVRKSSTGKRQYIQKRLSDADMRSIEKAVLSALQIIKT